MRGGLRRAVRRLIRGPATPSQWERLAAEGVVSVGPGTYGHADVHVHEFRLPGGRWVGATLRIGSYSSLAPCEVFLGGNHRSDWLSQYPFRSRRNLDGREQDGVGRGDVTIGSDVWVGHGALVMSGVTIGHGAVVGARAVVTRDVRPYAVVVGNPAREVHRRFDDVTVDRLLSDPWWERPAGWIADNVDHLCAPPARPLSGPAARSAQASPDEAVGPSRSSP